jgi:hypothetical protein
MLLENPLGRPVFVVMLLIYSAGILIAGVSTFGMKWNRSEK